MATSTATIAVHNPVTGELIEGITFQLFYNMHFVDGQRIVYVNGTATFELDENNEVIDKDVLPFRPRVDTTTAVPVEPPIPTDPAA